MLFVTHYELIGEPSKARTQELMALFGERGAGEGTLAHYVYADAGAGFVISDDSGLDSLYADAIPVGLCSKLYLICSYVELGFTFEFHITPNGF